MSHHSYILAAAFGAMIVSNSTYAVAQTPRRGAPRDEIMSDEAKFAPVRRVVNSLFLIHRQYLEPVNTNNLAQIFFSDLRKRAAINTDTWDRCLLDKSKTGKGRQTDDFETLFSTMVCTRFLHDNSAERINQLFNESLSELLSRLDSYSVLVEPTSINKTETISSFEKDSKDTISGIKMVDQVIIIRCDRINDHINESIRNYLKYNIGKYQSIVLDLRGNLGGSVEDVVSMADIFLDSGPITIIDGRQKGDRFRHLARPGPVAVSASMVVVVDANTSSGAEIVASALQDNMRAIVVGEPTAGHGFVQTLIPIEDGSYALKLTTSRVTRPNGKRLADNPVVPDCSTNGTHLDPLAFATSLAKQGAKICPTSGLTNVASSPG